MDGKLKFRCAIIDRGCLLELVATDLLNPDGSPYQDKQVIFKHPFLLRIRVWLWHITMRRRLHKARKLYKRWNEDERPPWSICYRG